MYVWQTSSKLKRCCAVMDALFRWYSFQASWWNWACSASRSWINMSRWVKFFGGFVQFKSTQGQICITQLVLMTSIITHGWKLIAGELMMILLCVLILVQDVIHPINQKGKDAIVLVFLDCCRYVVGVVWAQRVPQVKLDSLKVWGLCQVSNINWNILLVAGMKRKPRCKITCLPSMLRHTSMYLCFNYKWLYFLYLEQVLSQDFFFAHVNQRKLRLKSLIESGFRFFKFEAFSLLLFAGEISISWLFY